MVLGVDPLYLILIVMAGVALGLGAFGVVMWKMLDSLTLIANTLARIESLLTHAAEPPSFTKSVMDNLEGTLAKLRLASPDMQAQLASELLDAAMTLKQVSKPLDLVDFNSQPTINNIAIRQAIEKK